MARVVTLIGILLSFGGGVGGSGKLRKMDRTACPSRSSLDASFWQFPVAIKYVSFVLKTPSSLKRRMAGRGHVSGSISETEYIYNTVDAQSYFCCHIICVLIPPPPPSSDI
jgi:hypothetical protein